MKLRLLVPLLVFGLIAIGAVLVPAAASIAQQRTQQLERQRAEAFEQIEQRALKVVAGGGAGSGGAGSGGATARGSAPVLDQFLQRFSDTYREPAMVTDATGSQLTSVGELPRGEATTAAINDALRGIPELELPTVYPWSGTIVVAARPLMTEGNAAAGVVVIGISQEQAKQDVFWGWLRLASIGVALLAGLVAVGLAWTRWVLRPVRVLDAAANALAEQRSIESMGATGPPELRRLAASFERMARNVEAAIEQQRGLIADASHQLRNPLAAIRLRVDGLTLGGRGVDGATGPDPALSDAEAASTADDIAAFTHDLDRLERTLDRMLELARAEHRASVRQRVVHERVAAPAVPELLDVADTMTEECLASTASLVEPHRAMLATAGLAVQLVGESEAVRVACNASDLEEMVEILLDNAAKYAGEGATVTVSMRRETDRVVLAVADSGLGLSEAEIAQIGTRFWRAVSHRALPGTGLGHAIIAQIAYGNGATMVVDRAPEGGLRTRIELRAR